MPAAVHALLVARTAPEAAKALERTLEAVRSQSRPVDALTIVVCGPTGPVRELVSASGAEGVVEASATTTFAAAVEFAYRRVTPGASVWLLAHDSTPDPGALAALTAALERGPSIAIAAPKLVDEHDADRIVSLGQSMTRFGRTVELADGEFDQGQFDSLDDVLGADVRGVLVRGDIAADLVPDRALLGVDEGLDMGVRAHLAGRRVALVPRARLAVPPPPRRRTLGAAYLRRTAQLHRRLAYAPAWAVALHWLSYLPLALWKTAVQLIAKNPAFVPAEWAAAAVAMTRVGAVARSRRRIRRVRTASWADVEPLRVTAGDLRERHEPHGGPLVRRELRFFSGGGAWAVLAALVVNVLAFLALLSWPGVGGGGLLPLRRTVSGLWAEAAYGLRSVGVDVVSAADPFSAVTALLGSLWPGSPSFALLALWLLALPLAVLGAWFAATRVTTRSGLRVVMAVLWALAPSFLSALVDPRPASVVLHLLLPWLFFAAAAAHRSWGAAGSASLLLAAVLACAPSLAPAFAVMWALALVLVIVLRPRGIARVVWTVVPTIAAFLPLVAAQLDRGTPWALLSDPGLVWAGPVLGVAERWRLALGFPTSDPGGWGAFLAGMGLPAETWWVPFLLVPVVLPALLAPLTRRWRIGVAMLVVALAGLATAYAVLGIQVASAQSSAVGVWPGSALSLAWLGVIAAAAVTFDVGLAPRGVKSLGAVLATVCVALVAVPALTSVHRGQAALQSAGDSTLPAYISAQAASDEQSGTLVLSPQGDGGISSLVVWGASETLGGQSTLQATDPEPSASDERLAEITSDLIAAASTDVPAELSAQGIGFVLLAAGDEDTDAQRVLRLSAATSIDQRAGLVRVGETPRGVLWRIDTELTPREGLSADDAATARGVALAQLVALAVALLLAVPTPESRRAARRKPRVVGAGYEEAA
ncbi:glycosyl transferase [Microbacterium betulae]|uniref:Glycosyl transferase n=1 Tax=Microbacterium betulae TaxID=2981139 RepID=A0AA97I7F2_9MICO|nr:glycosyltransferase [Microbacterium sp. AB]WOF24192.1 glycosyl transferase [Microbacterium sp. AB]